MKILVIENDEQVVNDICLCLKMRYPDLVCVSTDKGERGIEMVETESPDLVIADSSLTGVNTLELVSNIRKFSDVPLIIISEAQTNSDRAKGLEVGVDEYFTKPLFCIEFLSTINALLRRTKGIGFKPKHTMIIGTDLTIDFNAHEVFISDKQIHLTPIEYKLLFVLARNNGRTIPHRTLLTKVWGSEYTDDLSFLKKYIYRLRCKIESEPCKPSKLITVRGIGYKLVKSI